MFRLTHKKPDWDDILTISAILKNQQECLVKTLEKLENLYDSIEIINKRIEKLEKENERR